MLKNITAINCHLISNLGWGTLFLTGLLGKPNILDNFMCRNNSANAGSSIFGKDIIIKIINSQIIENIANTESIFILFQASIKTHLIIIQTVIEYNSAKSSIIQTEFCQITLLDSIFVNNKIGLYIMKTKTSDIHIGNSNFVSNYVQNNGIEFIFLFNTAGILKIHDSIFQANQRHSIMFADKIKFINLTSNSFHNGSAYNGGALQFQEINELNINSCSFLGNKAEYQGGALHFYEISILKMYDCVFYENRGLLGSQIYLQNDKTDNALGLIEIVLSNFTNSPNKAIYFKCQEVRIFSCNFEGLSNEISQAIEFNQNGSIQINDSCFSNYFNLRIIESYNKNEETYNFYIENSFFNFSNTSLPGAIASFLGKFNIIISNSSFLNGWTSSNGGSFYFECKDYNSCSIAFQGSNTFYSNHAEFFGGAIYSLRTLFDIINITFISNTADAGMDVFTFPYKLLIIQEPTSEYEGNFKFISNVANLSSNNSIITKPGLPLNLFLLLTDHFGNIIKYDSETIFTIRPLIYSALHLENNLAKLESGTALFTKLTFIGPPSSYQLNLFSKFINLVLPLNLTLIPCSKGDTWQNNRCIQCPEGYFSLKIHSNHPVNSDDLSSNDECEKCPLNAFCPGGAEIIPYPGFWRMNEDSNLIFLCWQKMACPNQNVSSLEEGEGKGTNQAESFFHCGEGYWGNLCNNCDPGWTKDYEGCQDCSKGGYFFIFALQMMLSVIMAIIETFLTLQMHAISLTKPLIKIFFYHNAFLITISELSFDLSDEIKEMFGIVNDKATLTPSNIFDYSCFLTDLVHRNNIFLINLIIRVLFPLFYTLLVLISKTFVDIIIAYKKNLKYRFFKQLKINAIIIFFIAYRNWYARVILFTILVFKCKDLGTESYVLQNTELICWGDDHSFILISVCLPSIAVWAIGIPLFTYLLITKKKRGVELLENSQKNLIIVMKRKKNGKIRRKKFNALYVFLVSDYKNSQLYWQVVEFFILTVCLFTSQIVSIFDDLIRRMVLFIVYGSFLILYLKIEPYRHYLNNAMMCFSFGACLFTLIFEVVWFYEGDNSATMRYFAKSLILSINGLFYFSFILVLSKRWLDQNKAIITELVVTISGFLKKIK